MHNTPTLTPEQNEASRAHYANELAKMRGNAEKQAADTAELKQNFESLVGVSVEVASTIYLRLTGKSLDVK